MSYVVLQGIWDFIQDGSAVSSSNITRVCYLLNALTIMPGATLAKAPLWLWSECANVKGWTPLRPMCSDRKHTNTGAIN